MAKKVTEKKESKKVLNKINTFTLDVIEKQVRNFLIRTKNEEKKVDDILEAIASFRTDFHQSFLNEIKYLGLKEGESIPEDKVDEVNEKYKELVVKGFEVDKDKLSLYSKDEFDIALNDLVLPYNDLKILKYWLIKQSSI